MHRITLQGLAPSIAQDRQTPQLPVFTDKDKLIQTIQQLKEKHQTRHAWDVFDRWIVRVKKYGSLTRPQMHSLNWYLNGAQQMEGDRRD